jgi:type IV pilus assembly protein PilY1
MTQSRLRGPLLGALLILTALLSAGVGRADDSEIFAAPSAGTVGPNILLVVDTSGSMDSDVYSAAPYDPTSATAYPVTCNQNPNSSSTSDNSSSCGSGSGVCQNLFDENKVYIMSGSTTPTVDPVTGLPTAKLIPGCPTSLGTVTVLDKSLLKCADANASLYTTTGYATESLVQWRSAGTPTYAWNYTLTTSTTATPTEVSCVADYNARTGSYPITGTQSSGSLATPIYTSSPTLSYWAGSNAKLQPYTIYTGKYLNYYYYGAWLTGTRLSVVQSAAKNLVNSLSNVNMGVMRYASSSSSSNGGSSNSGGRVIAPVQALTTASKTSLNTAIDALSASGSTPLSETLYEAYLYYSGQTPVYGLSTASSTPNLTSGGKYISPIQYSCQRNFVVFLTDGLPTSDDDLTAVPYYTPTMAATGGSCDSASQSPYNLSNWGTSGNLGTTTGSGDPNSGRCLSAMAKYMFNADLNSSLSGQQNVQTYFIGFGGDPSLTTAFSYLQNAATQGGGQAFTASDLTSLQQVLTSIVSNILQISTTFTAPTVAVNAFNRTQTLNDLYVSVFQPSTNYHWPGNLKHYQLVNGTIADVTGQNAVDSSTGFFKSSSQSLWSPTVDGANIPIGGAANLIPNWNLTSSPHRNVYTYLGTNPSSPISLSTNAASNFDGTNSALTPAIFGTTSSTLRDSIIAYARGEDLRDENRNQSTTDSRLTMGDPLHAQPAAVIYGGTPTQHDPTDGVIFVAENDGFLHAFRTDTGVEQWAFIPQEVLPNLRTLYFNSPQSQKKYNLDGSVKVLKYDINGDGVIDASAGDRVFIYFSQGRGGSTYYALDVTDKQNPKYLWSLGPTQLPGIGQSWSSPQLARVSVGGGTQTSNQKLVLIFGGGYDSAEESEPYSKADTVGNAIYMVDAVSGTVLWRAGGTNSGADLVLATMDHAIPSDVTVLDTNGDGFVDRMYVGDMAGQIWRFDISNGSSRSTLVSGGVIASLGDHDLSTPTLADNRRFYNAPDVSVVQRRGLPAYINLAIGSGYRGHPLSVAAQDRLYAIRDYTPFTAMTSAQYSALTRIKDADLTDITSSVTPNVATTAKGWKLLLNQSGSSWQGEKVLSAATTLNNQILFTTYTPGGNATGLCQPALGINKFYAVSVIDGSPVANLNNQGNQAIADRSTTLAQTGIAPNLAFLFPAPVPTNDAAGNAIPASTQSNVLCMSGAEMLGSCKAYSSRVKTYWKESDAP